MLTAIGATYFASPSLNERAAAVAPMSTEATPKTCAKKPGALRETFSLIVSLVMMLLLTVIAAAATPPPFDVPVVTASVTAAGGLAGSDCAPASAEASAADCAARWARNHEPTSR